MKLCLTWISTLLLSATALLGAGCGPSCHSAPFCRWFDLATFCNDSGTCSVPPGMGLAPTDLDGEKDPWGTGYFQDNWSPTIVAVPLGEISGVLAQKPVLEVWLSAGAPLSLAGIAITFDGKAADCQLVKGGDRQNQIAFTCAVPVATQELGFAYTVAGQKGSPGNVAFDVQMFLHEPEGQCTGASEVCAL